MRLGLMLLRRTTNPNGHIYKGKNRIVKKVFPDDLQKMRNNFEIEERNMFLLRHSFLTAVSNVGECRVGERKGCFFRNNRTGIRSR